MKDKTLEEYFHRFSHDINCLNEQVKIVYIIYILKKG